MAQVGNVVDAADTARFCTGLHVPVHRSIADALVHGMQVVVVPESSVVVDREEDQEAGQARRE